jgi:hypothetical protein
MSTDRRVAKLEHALPARHAVRLWFEAAIQYPSLAAYARSCLDQDDPTADLTRIHDQVVASVTEALRGKSRVEIPRLVRVALRDAAFLYQLVLILNTTAAEIARLGALRSLVLVGQLGQLVSDPMYEPGAARRADPEAARAIDAAWQTWRETTESFVGEVEVEALARATLDDAHFGGRPVLFAEVAEDWIRLVEQADRLQFLVGTMREPFRTRAGFHRRPPLLPATSSTIADRARSRAADLADDARIAAFEFFGEHHLAAAIAQRRLLV